MGVNITQNIPQEVQGQIDTEAAAEQASGGGFGIIEGDEEGSPIIDRGGEVISSSLGSQVEEQGEPLHPGQLEETSHEEPVPVVEEEPYQTEEGPAPEAAPDPVGTGTPAEAEQQGAPKDPKHFQRIAEARLNEINRLQELPEHQVGRMIGQNPALLQVIQAINSGQVSVDQVLQAGTPVQATPLQAPEMPQQPRDFNPAEVGVEGTPSHKHQEALNQYLTGSIDYLVKMDQRRQADQVTEVANKKAEVEREGTVQSLMSIYGYGEVDAKAFVDKYSRPGSMSLDLIVRADRAQAVNPNGGAAQARVDAHVARGKKLVARSPAAPVGGSGGGGSQESEKQMTDEELFNMGLDEGEIY